eukprot:g14182.t1
MPASSNELMSEKEEAVPEKSVKYKYDFEERPDGTYIWHASLVLLRYLQADLLRVWVVSSPMVLRERNATPEEAAQTGAREGKKVLVSAEKKATPEPTHPILAPSPVRCRKLEPSLQEGTGTVGGSRGCPFPNNAMGLKSHADHGGERERRTSRECYRPHDWSASLREETESKQFWGKEFQPTVPLGPRLRTEERSRSRSCSRECTPQCTPTRRSQSRSMTPGRGMPAKEQVAVEQYLSRMSLARLDSPMQKFAFGSRGSDLSRDSRLSHLSRPRSLSKDLLSTEEQGAAEERRALRKQLRRNRRKYKEALLGGSVTERCTERMLTTPMERNHSCRLKHGTRADDDLPWLPDAQLILARC